MIRKEEKYLEMLRGFLAIFVSIEHFIFTIPISSTKTLGEIIAYRIPSHQMVLVFFILSGYVIGLTNERNQPFSLKTYFFKRFIRLYPIYFVCLILAFIVHQESIKVFISTLFFQQALWTAPPIGNSPMWSLNHEVFYYTLFAIICFLKLNPWIVIFLSLMMGFLPLFSPVYVPFYIYSYGIGFFFWLSGLLLAWYTEKENKVISTQMVISWFLLFLSVRALNPFKTIGQLNTPFFDHLHQYFGAGGMLNVFELFYFPICFVTVIFFSNAKFRFSKLLFVATYISYILYSGYIIFQIKTLDTYFFPAVVCVFLSIIILVIPLHSRIEEWFTFLGKTSYGLYLCHVPVMFVLNFIWPKGFINIYMSVLYLLSYVGLSIWVGYLLEIKFQPIVANYLKKKWLTN